MKRLLSGIKPTGELTLGNYIGAIKQFIEMQNEYETFIFVADLHALTVYNEPSLLKTRIREMLGLYLACGLDPKQTTIFVQSENMYHTNLSWVLECNSYMGEMSRMTQFKDKTKNGNSENISCGLFTYPTLMASDILIYDADVVPTGIDQKQHVELARNLAERFNNKYGETFKVPEPIIPKEGAKIYDLQNPTKKMSKTEESVKGCILLTDEPEVARKKIMSAVTDGENNIKYDPLNKPGISNLLVIYSSLKNIDIKSCEEECAGLGYGDFKKKVADVVANFLEDLQTKYKSIVDANIIDKILDESNEKVINIAKNKVDEVFAKIGVGR